MRCFLISVLSLMLVGSAAAASGLPHFKTGTPWSIVRGQLIRHGYAPVAVTDKLEPDAKFCGDRCVPELVQCAADAPLCEYLFVRLADGALVTIQTRYESGKPGRSSDEIERFETLARSRKSDYSDKTLTIPHRSAAKP